jgi:hypothetical protein
MATAAENPASRFGIIEIDGKHLYEDEGNRTPGGGYSRQANAGDGNNGRPTLQSASASGGILQLTPNGR